MPFLPRSLLFPDNVAEYGGHDESFLSRRKWFFDLLGVTFVFDFLVTLLKGWRTTGAMAWSIWRTRPC